MQKTAVESALKFGAMEPIIQEKKLLSPDVRLVTRLVCNIALIRRHVRTYPKNHIITVNAVERTTLLIDRLFDNCDTFTMGVARESIVIDGGILEGGNPFVTDLARALFSHGIATVTFSKGLTSRELLSFIELTASKPVWERGKFHREMNAAGISCIDLNETDYQQFRITEEEGIIPAFETGEESDSLWERLILELLEGNLDPDVSVGELSPEGLAGVFNAIFETNPELFCISDYSHVINEFIRQMEEEAPGSMRRDRAIDQLCAFLGSLAPEIRFLFLNSSFSMLSTGDSLAEEMLSRFPDEIVAEIMENIRSNRSTVPPIVLKIMENYTEKLMANRGDRLFPPVLDTAGRTLDVWMNPIFCEDALVIDEKHRTSIDRLIAASTISDLGRAEIEERKQDLAGHSLERKLTEVLLELINAEREKSDSDSLADHLLEQCRYFLEIGDFESLCRTYERLIHQHAGNPDEPSPAKLRLLDFFRNAEFVNGVLDGPAVWGKVKYDEIQQLILLVGRPFVRPMLDRMAEESSMSVRRYYLDRLQELGNIAIGDVLERLNDSRWYCIRNMLVILRSSNDPSILPEVYKLINYSHPKIRFELIRTLQHFNDPEADRLLLKDLLEGPPLLQINAVTLSRYSSSPEVLRALLKILDQPGYAGSELDLKVGVIQSLSAFASPECVPALERLLNSKQILYMFALNRMKQEVIRSLARYPSELATPLLLGVIKRGSGKLSQQAQECLNSLGGRS